MPATPRHPTRPLLATLLALWPALAGAQDATRHAWGYPVDHSGPSVLSLGPCAAPCAVLLRFDNTLISLGGGPPVTVHSTLALGGVRVEVSVAHGGGMTPDLLSVRPAPGYAAEPAEVLVDDDSSALVRVVPVPMS